MRLRVDRIRIARRAEQPLRLRVRLDQLRRAIRRGRSGAGSRASSRRSGRWRSSRRTPGHMLPSVARSAIVRCSRPGPKNSTNLPTTPCLRSRSVIVSTRSVAVAPSSIAPVSRKPSTGGISIEIGWPSIAASASMPPTPQPDHAQPVDHRRVRVGADERVGVRERARPASRRTRRRARGIRGSPGARCRCRAARRGNCGTRSGPSAGTRSAPCCARTRARRSAGTRSA